MRVFFTIDGKPFGWDRVTPTARIIGEGSDARAIASLHDSSENKAAKTEIRRLWRVAARGHSTISGPVRLKVVGIFETPESWPRAVHRAAAECRVWHVGRPDLDNIQKLILDALNKLAWADDGQVAVIECAKRYGSPARVEVTVSTIPQQPDEITPGQRRLEKRVADEGWDQVLAAPARRASPSKTQSREPIPARMSAAEFRKLGSKAGARMPERKPR